MFMEETKQSNLNLNKFGRLIGLVLILGLLTIIGMSIYKRYQTIGKAEYSVGVNTIRGNDVQTNFNSHLIGKDGQPIFWFNYIGSGGSGVVDASIDWDSVQRTEGTWEIPAGFKLMWLSMYEGQGQGQFFELEGQLPYTEIKESFDEKIFKLFYNSEHRALSNDRNYEHLVFLIAPKGKVYVYVSGYEAKLLGIYQGKPIDYDWWQWKLDTATNKEEYQALKQGEHSYKTIGGTHIDIDDREAFIQAFRRPEDFEIMKQMPLYYHEGFFNPVQWTFKISGRNAKLLTYESQMLNGEVRIVHKPKEQTTPLHAIPVTLMIDFLVEDQAYRYFINLSGNESSLGGKHSTELYQFWQDNFDTSQPVEIEVELFADDTLNVWYKQGDKKLLSEVVDVTEVDR